MTRLERLELRAAPRLPAVFSAQPMPAQQTRDAQAVAAGARRPRPRPASASVTSQATNARAELARRAPRRFSALRSAIVTSRAAGVQPRARSPRRAPTRRRRRARWLPRSAWRRNPTSAAVAQEQLAVGVADRQQLEPAAPAAAAGHDRRLPSSPPASRARATGRARPRARPRAARGCSVGPPSHSTARTPARRAGRRAPRQRRLRRSGRPRPARPPPAADAVRAPCRSARAARAPRTARPPTACRTGARPAPPGRRGARSPRRAGAGADEHGIGARAQREQHLQVPLPAEHREHAAAPRGRRRGDHHRGHVGPALPRRRARPISSSHVTFTGTARRARGSRCERVDQPRQLVGPAIGVSTGVVMPPRDELPEPRASARRASRR